MIYPWARVRPLSEIIARFGPPRDMVVVWTNGCFDLLQVGHAELITEAAKLGDILIVGVNSDRSVREFKGPNRPIQSEGDRAALISTLSGVTWATIFDDPLPCEAIAALQPDIVVKGRGGGWDRVEELPEYPIVSRYGGRVALVGRAFTTSTTRIIETILDWK